jgi:hypothetical protein
MDIPKRLFIWRIIFRSNCGVWSYGIVFFGQAGRRATDREPPSHRPAKTKPQPSFWQSAEDIVKFSGIGALPFWTDINPFKTGFGAAKTLVKMEKVPLLQALLLQTNQATAAYP